MPHIDAAGLSTFVKIVTGKKYWCIGYKSPDKDDKRTVSDNPSSGMHWRCLAIERGDVLYMPPFTPHFVLTTEDCFAVGGHFYNYECMEKTMEAIVVEHYFGLNWVNTEHPTAPIILFKMLDVVFHNFSLHECACNLLFFVVYSLFF